MLETQVGPLTVQEWGLVLLGIVVFFSVLNFITARMKKTAGADKLAEASCLVCGWSGRVSRYHRTCPKCGNSITRLRPKAR